MELNFTTEEEAFRAEVRAFLADKLPVRLSAKVRGGQILAKADMEEWHAHCRIKNATRADLLPRVICYPSDGPAGAKRRDKANQHGNTQGVGRRTAGAVWRRDVG